MASIFITGSTEGLGLGAARELLAQGHRVVLHARSAARAKAVADLGCDVVLGDLASAGETRSVADQVNALGRMDAVIHNAGIFRAPSRGPTPEGHAVTLAVNTLAAYILTALIRRPDRLIYLSSGLHRGGEGSLRDIDWIERRWDAGRAYAESKLQLVALAMGLSRRWPGVLSHAVDPGWVPTRMGGRGAPGDLQEGHRTQAWLAVSNDSDVRPGGGYWHHRKRQPPAAEAADPTFQEALLAKLAELTGVALPE
jgi:NAD(P)-dependent dehydrogenase (short-subunit alcohol dehydrogenase family)